MAETKDNTISRLAFRVDYLRSSGTLKDLWFIRDIDVKGLHDPWSVKEWVAQVKMFGVYVATNRFSGRIVGFLAPFYSSVVSGDKHLARVAKLAVHPDCRRRGVGNTLMHRFITDSLHEQYCKIDIQVPEELCTPSAPNDVSTFLKQWFPQSILEREALKVDGYKVDAVTFMIDVPSYTTRGRV